MNAKTDKKTVKRRNVSKPKVKTTARKKVTRKVVARKAVTKPKTKKAVAKKAVTVVKDKKPWQKLLHILQDSASKGELFVPRDEFNSRIKKAGFEPVDGNRFARYLWDITQYAKIHPVSVRDTENKRRVLGYRLMPADVKTAAPETPTDAKTAEQFEEARP